MKFLILSIAIFLSGCDESSFKRRDLSPSFTSDGQKIYRGSDKNGNIKSCTQAPESYICTQTSYIDTSFQKNCIADGNQAIDCGCSQYICIDKSEEKSNNAPHPILTEPTKKTNPGEILSDWNISYIGVDVEGETKTCSPMKPEWVCTTEFTEADQFALECRDSGIDTVRCNCEDWICLI